MPFAIGRLFYEENRKMFLVPGKVRNIEVRNMEATNEARKRPLSASYRYAEHAPSQLNSNPPPSVISKTAVNAGLG
ncbi:hypothetical protein TNCV_2109691 [Trichonephila clavipes]|nr:hypothetical protein TNCV_2109691 [Trichonephila clavipes]